MIYSQIFIFIIYVLAGIVLSFLFDFFRILRKCFTTSNLVTYIEDTIFWIAVFITLIAISNKFKNMEPRFYNFFGLLVGGIIYFTIFSKFTIKLGVKLFSFFKKILKDFVSFCRNKK